MKKELLAFGGGASAPHAHPKVRHCSPLDKIRLNINMIRVNVNKLRLTT